MGYNSIAGIIGLSSFV